MRETNGQQVKHLYILYERETGIISRDAKIEREVLYVGVIFEKKTPKDTTSERESKNYYNYRSYFCERER